jgi:CRISPR system Cascade subunit CasB
MATMAPRIHRQNRRLGEVLRETEYSEARLTRLLRAESASALAYEFYSVTRWCSVKRVSFDWTDAVPLVLGRVAGRSDAERAARGIARDYFRPSRPRDPDTSLQPEDLGALP